jgi:serine/threonine-protein kinase RsbW
MYCFSSFDEFIMLRDTINEKLMGISGDGALRLFIAINEGVNNAIFHGNKEDSSKKVYLTIEEMPNEIKIVIRDEGQGFDNQDKDDATDLWGEHGRGLDLIKHCVDSYWRNDLGNEMTLVKKITSG